MGEDVKRFIDTKIPHLPKVKSLSDADQVWIMKHLKTHLKTHSEESFLWVALVIEMLETSRSISRGSVQDMLGSLPHNVPGVYKKILGKVTGTDRGTSRFPLQMIAAYYSPLTTADLTWLNAAHACHCESSKIDDFMVADFQETIRRLCGLFGTNRRWQGALTTQVCQGFPVNERNSRTPRTCVVSLY